MIKAPETDEGKESGDIKNKRGNSTKLNKKEKRKGSKSK